MAAAKKSQEVAEKFPTIPADALADMSSFEEAVAIAREYYGAENVVEAADVLGDGFKTLENKVTLIGVPFFIVSWNFVNGDHGEYVLARVITQDNQKLIITDGSRGIKEMLANYSKSSSRYGGLFVRKGLRKSDYTYTDDQGKDQSATTYYLDVSA